MQHLTPIDWGIIVAFFAVSLFIGLLSAGRAGSNAKEFFLSGQNMPWWLIGVSMVATTFSADTPNLVTDIVRQRGVSGNWVWWAFLLTGMFTVFVYAALWRRLGVMTDIEFYELRYSGRAATFLRGFRAVYLGLVFNVLIMASVSLAAIKIGAVLLGLTPLETLLAASLVTVAYSALGGLRGVMLTDMFQFWLALGSSIAATVVLLNRPEVGGLGALLAHPEIAPRLSIFPDFEALTFRELLPLFILPLAVQWWSVWYPGSEPGGGGYVVQRILSAKNERHAVGGTLFFNVAHYALRPWPWILVALASLLVFPDLATLAERFPHVPPDKLGHDLAYPAMMSLLPAGLIGLVIASLIAAYMSTISTQLNWGASYLVNDVYQRFVRPEASAQELVRVGRGCTVLLMVLSGALALLLESALSTFQILMQIGAGTGALFLARWFWPRVNAWSEAVAMVVSFCFAAYAELIHPRVIGNRLPVEEQMMIGVALTTVAWVATAWWGPSNDPEVLQKFYVRIRPPWGWAKVREQAEASGAPLPPPSGNLPVQLLCVFLGTVAVYGALLGTGAALYGQMAGAAVLGVLAMASAAAVMALWRRGLAEEAPPGGEAH